MADLKKFAEQLVNLTVKEVNELADILKDEYGIEPAAAAVAVAGPAGGVAAGGGEEEKSEFDVILKAAGGSKRKGKKPTKVTKSSLRTMKKVELIFQAKKDFGIKLDSNLSKTALINKVYELHHKK